jgi:cell division protein FtsB
VGLGRWTGMLTGRTGNPEPGRGRLTARLRLATAEYAQRRQAATAFALAVALLLGFHAMFGRNGIVNYETKRSEDRDLTRQIGAIQLENARLAEHVEHLKNDPDTIEREAHVRLRYAKPGQVIVLNDDATPPAPAHK